MKNFASILVLLTLALAWTNCKKTTTDPSGSVTFKVDSTTNFTSSVAGSTWEATNKTLNITAKGGKSIIVINVGMPNGIKTGTYAFTAASASSNTGAFYRPDTSIITEQYVSYLDAKTFGTLVITEFTADSLISGTFTYNLKDPVSNKVKVITAGIVKSVKVVNSLSISSAGSTFTAKIDGTAWTAKQVNGVVASGKLSLVASDGTKNISLSVPSNIAVGNYTMDFFTGTHIGTYSPTSTGTTVFTASTATSKLTITEHSTTAKQIKGTFNFKAEEFGGTKSYNITEGAFTVKY